MESQSEFGEMVTYPNGPGRHETMYGIVVSQAIGLSEVPALGRFYYVRTAGNVCMMSAHRLMRPSALPTAHPQFVRRGQFDE